MADCCASTLALCFSPFDCFERGLKTRKLPALEIAGERVFLPTDASIWTAFSLRLQGHEVQAMRFSCSSCTSLIASCQVLCELATHQSLAGLMQQVTVCKVQALMPGIPAGKTDRVALAVTAFQDVLSYAQGVSK